MGRVPSSSAAAGLVLASVVACRFGYDPDSGAVDAGAGDGPSRPDARVLACDQGNASFVGSNGHCYTRHDGATVFEVAQEACYGLGGYLVTITTQAEQDDLGAERDG